MGFDIPGNDLWMNSSAFPKAVLDLKIHLVTSDRLNDKDLNYCLLFFEVEIPKVLHVIYRDLYRKDFYVLISAT